MAKTRLEEILEKGIYGTPEIRPDERKLFLSTISERVYLVLTNTQVRTKGMYNEVEEVMKKHSNVHLYLNGSLSYQHYSNYIKAATKQSVPFTIINDGHETPLGLVLASQQAIDSPAEFFIKDDNFYKDMPEEK